MKINLVLKKMGVTAALLVITISVLAQANTTLSNLVSPTSVNVNLLPKVSTRSVLNIGNSTHQWSNLYLSGSVYLNGYKFISSLDTFSTFVGVLAGNSNSAHWNSGFGYHALYANTSGFYNTAAGEEALTGNTTGSFNVAFGSVALFSNTSGTGNTAIGHEALLDNNTGEENTAIGSQALFNNTTGIENTAVGSATLFQNSTGQRNTAIGSEALYSNRTGNYNVALGNEALTNTYTGNSNVAIGSSALLYMSNLSNLVAIGDSALLSVTTGTQLTAIGSKALSANTSGAYNTATGYQALFANTGGGANTAYGNYSLHENTTGDGNTAIGSSSLTSNTTGSYNTCVGYYAYPLTASISNYTGIGYDVGTNSSASNMVEIGNSSVTVIRGAVNFSTYSDERIKNNIKNNVPGLAFINLLKPVTYNIDLDKEASIIYKNKKSKDNSNDDFAGKYDLGKQLKTGFLAQQVEEAAKKVNYDFSGIVKPQNENDLYSLRYSEFVVPLVKAVQELSKENDSLKIMDNSLQDQINQLKAMIVSSANTNQSTLISSASLQQNIPNPFSSSTTIGYNLPSNYSSANIIVTDAKGVVLKQISLNARGKGNVQLDASTLAAGAYLYSLYVDGKIVDSKQMISSK